MSSYEDLTGQKFGRLTVVSIDGYHEYPSGRKSTKWICRCECGNQVSVIGQNLKSGTTKSCGCIRLEDLTGKRFGRLVVIGKGEVKRNATHWRCLCDCGNVVDVVNSHLLKGISKSCGCIRADNGRKKVKNLTGQRFGKLTVLEQVESKNGRSMWKCLCDCGNYKIASSSTLHNGRTRSCGCLEPNKTHGKANTRLYRIYSGMKARCYNQNTKAYKHYGGRGITICDEWLGENGFVKFYDWSIKNGYSENLSIDRIDVNGNYEPSNCRWADAKTQSINKRNKITIYYGGEEKTLVELSEEFEINYETLRHRIFDKKMDVEKALLTPVRISNRK